RPGRQRSRTQLDRPAGRGRRLHPVQCLPACRVAADRLRPTRPVRNAPVAAPRPRLPAPMASAADFRLEIVRVSLATDSSTRDWPNEDFAAITPGVAVLIDGAGSPGGRETGCVHGVAWYARTLGAHLAASAVVTSTALADVLADSISQVSAMHSGTCDLHHPGTPSATVVLVRTNGDTLEYLVLTDSVLLLLPIAGEPVVISDTRLEDIAAGLRPNYRELARSREREAVRQAYLSKLDALRNQPGGYWSAAADPAAAE